MVLGSLDLDDPFMSNETPFSISEILTNFLYTDTNIFAPTESTLPMNIIESISPEQKKFTFQFINDGETNSYNIYINHSDNVPTEHFVWDYYGHAELFCNFRSHNLIAWKDSFIKLFTGYFIAGRLPVPTTYNLTPYTFVTSISFEDRYAWMFPIDTFFESEKITISQPLCSYLTINSSEFSLFSEHYSFANAIENIPTCSHPFVAASGKHAICSYYPSTSSCSVQVPLTKTLQTQTVSILNTSQTITFNLLYHISDRFEHVFKIVNATDNVIVNTFSYPISNSYQDLLSEVSDIFNTYLSSYNDSSYSISQEEVGITPTNKDTTKVSYIESLIGV